MSTPPATLTPATATVAADTDPDPINNEQRRQLALAPYQGNNYSDADPLKMNPPCDGMIFPAGGWDTTVAPYISELFTLASCGSGILKIQSISYYVDRGCYVVMVHYRDRPESEYFKATRTALDKRFQLKTARAAEWNPCLRRVYDRSRNGILPTETSIKQYLLYCMYVTGTYANATFSQASPFVTTAATLLARKFVPQPTHRAIQNALGRLRVDREVSLQHLNLNADDMDIPFDMGMGAIPAGINLANANPQCPIAPTPAPATVAEPSVIAPTPALAAFTRVLPPTGNNPSVSTLVVNIAPTARDERILHQPSAAISQPQASSFATEMKTPGFAVYRQDMTKALEQNRKQSDEYRQRMNHDRNNMRDERDAATQRAQQLCEEIQELQRKLGGQATEIQHLREQLKLANAKKHKLANERTQDKKEMALTLRNMTKELNDTREELTSDLNVANSQLESVIVNRDNYLNAYNDIRDQLVAQQATNGLVKERSERAEKQAANLEQELRVAKRSMEGQQYFDGFNTKMSIQKDELQQALMAAQTEVKEISRQNGALSKDVEIKQATILRLTGMMNDKNKEMCQSIDHLTNALREFYEKQQATEPPAHQSQYIHNITTMLSVVTQSTQTLKASVLQIEPAMKNAIQLSENKLQAALQEAEKNIQTTVQATESNLQSAVQKVQINLQATLKQTEQSLQTTLAASFETCAQKLIETMTDQCAARLELIEKLSQDFQVKLQVVEASSQGDQVATKEVVAHCQAEMAKCEGEIRKMAVAVLAGQTKLTVDIDVKQEQWAADLKTALDTAATTIGKLENSMGEIYTRERTQLDKKLKYFESILTAQHSSSIARPGDADDGGPETSLSSRAQRQEVADIAAGTRTVETAAGIAALWPSATASSLEAPACIPNTDRGKKWAMAKKLADNLVGILNHELKDRKVQMDPSKNDRRVRRLQELTSTSLYTFRQKACEQVVRDMTDVIAEDPFWKALVHRGGSCSISSNSSSASFDVDVDPNDPLEEFVQEEAVDQSTKDDEGFLGFMRVLNEHGVLQMSLSHYIEFDRRVRALQSLAHSMPAFERMDWGDKADCSFDPKLLAQVMVGAHPLCYEPDDKTNVTVNMDKYEFRVYLPIPSLIVTQYGDVYNWITGNWLGARDPSSKEYPRVRTRTCEGYWCTLQVHIIVAALFLEPPKYFGSIVDHISRNRQDPRADNLRRLTSLMNNYNVSEWRDERLEQHVGIKFDADSRTYSVTVGGIKIEPAFTTFVQAVLAYRFKYRLTKWNRAARMEKFVGTVMGKGPNKALAQLILTVPYDEKTSMNFTEALLAHKQIDIGNQINGGKEAKYANSQVSAEELILREVIKLLCPNNVPDIEDMNDIATPSFDVFTHISQLPDTLVLNGNRISPGRAEETLVAPVPPRQPTVHAPSFQDPNPSAYEQYVKDKAQLWNRRKATLPMRMNLTVSDIAADIDKMLAVRRERQHNQVSVLQVGNETGANTRILDASGDVEMTDAN
jgi:hypothetical protein